MAAFFQNKLKHCVGRGERFIDGDKLTVLSALDEEMYIYSSSCRRGLWLSINKVNVCLHPGSIHSIQFTKFTVHFAVCY